MSLRGTSFITRIFTVRAVWVRKSYLTDVLRYGVRIQVPDHPFQSQRLVITKNLYYFPSLSLFGYAMSNRPLYRVKYITIHIKCALNEERER